MSEPGRRQHPDQIRAENEWKAALGNGAGTELALQLAGELAGYTGEDLVTVRRRMEHGTEDLAALWTQRGVDPGNPDSLLAFYNAGMTEAYELMHWHGGGLGRYPTQHVMAAWLARQVGARRVLDYGTGVGSAAIMLARKGFEVAAADISAPLLDFARKRFAARGLEVDTFLLPRERPPRSRFDVAMCVDVFEHVPDPAGLVSEIAAYLRTGGLLVGVLYEDSTGPDRPMHVSSCGPVAEFARRTNLWVDWRLTERIARWGGWCTVFRKLPAGGLLRRLERRLSPDAGNGRPSRAKRALEAVLPLRGT